MKKSTKFSCLRLVLHFLNSCRVLRFFVSLRMTQSCHLERSERSQPNTDLRNEALEPFSSGRNVPDKSGFLRKLRIAYCVLRIIAHSLTRSPAHSLTLFLVSLSPGWAAPYFRESGLVDIPIGKVIEHGIFNIGTYAAFRNADKLPRDEAALRLDFGLFDRVEIGLTSVRYNQEGYLSGNLKVLLFREADTVPNVAIGIENVGAPITIESGLNDLTRYKRRSLFLAVSKEFNLPRVHQISGHIGIGNRRFVEDIGMGQVLNGVFLGVSKDFQPAFARGNVAFSIEVDGRGVNAGVRHTSDSGLQVYIGAEALNAPATAGKEIRYVAGVAWTNRPLMKRIEEAKKLAKQAGLIANEAKRIAEEEKEPTHP